MAGRIPGAGAAGACRRATPRRPRTVSTALGLAVALLCALVQLVFGAAQRASAATSLNVFVGYMDTHSTPSSANQPNPWPYTDPSSYLGTPCANYPNDTTCWDASAVRLDNPSGTDVTGVHPVVVIGGSTYDLWGSNVTVPAHSMMVLTETGGQNSENFDGSDFSPNDYNGGNTASCTNSGAIPDVQLTIAGITSSFVDSGQVLNGGGVDSGHCVNGSFVSARLDESHPWVQIGSGTASVPSAPRSLAATGGSGSVSLSWTAPASDGGSAITGYDVYRGTSAGAEASSPVATNVSTANFTDTGLINGTRYFYLVRAVNGVGSSPPSNEASAVPVLSAPTVPTPPRSLTATPGSGSVSLSWAAPTGTGGSPITGYNVYRGTAAGAEVATPLAGNVHTLSYLDHPDPNGSVYFYRVTAVNAVGISAVSNEASATPQPTVPTAPQGLAAAGGPGSVALSWTVPLSDGGSGVTGYSVYRGATSGGQSAIPIATNVTVLHYTDSTAGNGSRWYYQVAAVNGIGTSPRSSEASASAGGTPGAFVAMAPQRVLDSRSAVGAAGPVPAGGSVSVQVTGRAGVPGSGVGSVALTVTVTSAGGAGYVTVYAAGGARPGVSNLNFVAGQTVADFVVTRVSASGVVTLFNGSARTIQLIADVSGYYLAGVPSAAGAFVAMVPQRVLDSRSAVGAAGPVPAGGSVSVQVTGRAGVPGSGVGSVALTVTVTSAGGAGYVTVYAAGGARPGVSNLNFVAGQTVAGFVVTRVSASGVVTLFNGSARTIQLIADVSGYYLAGVPSAAGAFVAMAPQRVLDSRSAVGAAGPVPAGGSVSVQVTGRAGVPGSGVGSVALTVTVTSAGGAGYVTVYAAGGARPGVSNLNFVAGQTVADFVVTRVSASGVVTLFNGSARTIQLIADVSGYYRS